MMTLPYLMIISYPHQWRDATTLTFATEEERQAYYDEFASRRELGQRGEERYTRVRFATVTDEVH